MHQQSVYGRSRTGVHGLVGEGSPAGPAASRGTLADLLAAHRAETGLSQEALAEAAGLSVRAVRDLEAGRVRVPQQRSAASLARVLSLSGAARERFLATVAEARRDRARVRADGPPAAPVPAQLPPSPPHFTGRVAEAAVLGDRLLHDAAARPGEPPARRAGGGIAVVTGQGGLGKTALALHTAHRLREHFPDGQLYLDLRASRGAPLDTEALLARLLRALGVPDGSVPPDLAARTALYRRATAGRRLLVVLDDAPGAAGVRALLPGGRTCAVLLTSRHRDAGPEPGAAELRLAPLPHAEAAELFARLAGPGRVAAEPEAAAALVDFCAGSPLVLRVTAGRLSRRPGWSIAAVLKRLTQEWSCLDALVAGDMSVRENLRCAYLGLPLPSRVDAVDPALVFRALGTSGIDTVTAEAVARLLGVTGDVAGAALSALAAVHLLEPSAPGCWRLPGPARLYALELAGAWPGAGDSSRRR
ncbi:NB-ARC domain-containing protein [Streptomyces sp. TRM 70351]|uniref:NB-ARC domain-containing protein n=1 Tax=Streptomyces sp. TRM 70351 TaxID=3116552 RepID=UPI002E7C2EFB|nr:NB-ARC domain-containing protein [Streptomyces sp. TRM 70351]MEE1927538.1 NB-ARC domain-containing protein [Streptomyces sp. TRM 70351]